MKTKRLLPLSLLVCITVLAAVLRLYKLGEVPVSIYWDEAAFGYNAYSLLKTGADEYGSRFPLLLRSFDDYKFAGYAYFSIPFIALFGLSEFSIRIASSVAGIATVAAVYFFVRTLGDLSIDLTSTISFGRKKIKFQEYVFNYGILSPKEIVALGSAFILAISPWHIQFSRAGFEANVSLLFIALGGVSFLYGIKKHMWLFMSAVCFGLSLYFYRGALVFGPLFFLALAAIFIRTIPWRLIILSTIVLFLIVLPILFAMTSREAQIRSNQVFIGNQRDHYLYQSALNIQKADNAMWARLYYNRRLILLRGFIENYVRHFGVDYLVTDGDPNLRHHVGGMGMLYYWQLPFLVVGILFASMLKDKRFIGVLLAWLLLSPIAASLSYPSPHALRSLYMVVPLSILSFIGLYIVILLVPKKIEIGTTIIISIVIIYSLVVYLSHYYSLYPLKSSQDWGDGYKQMVEYVVNQEALYDRIVISGHYWKPYIYVLFYTNYDPSVYQKSGSSSAFNKYAFGGTGWGAGEVELDQVDLLKFSGTDRTLFFLSPNEYKKHAYVLTIISSIKNSKGLEMFYAGVANNVN